MSAAVHSSFAIHHFSFLFSSLSRVLRYAIRDFSRNVWLSMTTVLILTLTLVSVQVLLAVNIAGRTALRELESRVDLRVQFRTEVSEADVDTIRVSLERRPDVIAVTHTPRAAVLEEFQSIHQSNPDILAALAELGENPFGAELRIHVRSPDDFPSVVSFFADPTLKERIIETSTADRVVLVDQLRLLTRKLRIAGLALSGVSFFVTLLIIINAMRIATYARREEVGIMKLVGATNWFVRTPFLIMGVLASLFATILAQAVTLPGLRVVEPMLIEFLGQRALDVRAFFVQYWWQIAFAEFLGLALLTMVISAIAIRRYLRV